MDIVKFLNNIIDKVVLPSKPYRKEVIFKKAWTDKSVVEYEGKEWWIHKNHCNFFPGLAIPGEKVIVDIRYLETPVKPK